MPPSNQQRRDDITDAAVEIVQRDGLHGLSHRAVDEEAGVPRGTTSNYFRSREALLGATARRIVELHFALIEEVRAQHTREPGKTNTIELLSSVVDQALSRFPGRYLTMFELSLESTRRPELRREFARITDESMKLTQEAHINGGDEPSRQDVELLNAFYNGVLFTSLVMPQTMGGRSPGEITRAMLELVLETDSPGVTPVRRKPKQRRG
ncbi:TetR/AcrR family transcriptional regulator [Streptomyces marispadix]|uniref:TetR family transcriptional regulator n=1 Tax=Streptomyces marispadix TaxID=2922868 RepID=A0ABS9T5Q1_9ACTN|nr:TetR/AcrR family transcriptional regulator [Streptomyces marispadix]MCH6163830.1 TetR family transcriptional regulator [Streptomyces marispadix]